MMTLDATGVPGRAYLILAQDYVVAEDAAAIVSDFDRDARPRIFLRLEDLLAGIKAEAGKPAILIVAPTRRQMQSGVAELVAARGGALILVGLDGAAPDASPCPVFTIPAPFSEASLRGMLAEEAAAVNLA